MTKLRLLTLLCLAFFACTNEVDDSEPNDDSTIVLLSTTSTHTFIASSGNAVVLRVVDVGNTTAIPKLTVTDPAGNVVATASGPNVAGASFRAAATGTFTVTISDISSSPPPGAIFALNLAIAPGAAKDGTLKQDAIASGHIDEGEIDSYTFTAAAGQHIFLRVADVTGGALVPSLTIYDPAGNQAAANIGGNVAGVAFAATSTGTFTVVLADVSSGLASTGDYKLYFVSAQGTNKDGALPRGSVVTGHIDEGEIDTFTFAANAGESVTLQVDDLLGGALLPSFAIYDTAGNLAASASGANTAIATFTAAATGTFTIVLADGSSGLASTGDYRLSLK